MSVSVRTGGVMKMRKISRQALRSKAVGNVLASLRIERLSPSGEVAEALHDCIEGRCTTRQILEGVIRRHVTLRRN